MRRFNKAILAAAVAAGLGTGAQAQIIDIWGFGCFDPANTQPVSTDYFVTGQVSDYMMLLVGISGTVTFGGGSADTGIPCYETAQTLSAAGRWTASIGPVGSRQTSFDDLLTLTMGWPRPVASWNYIEFVEVDTATGGQTKTRWGSTGFGLVFDGASDRYFVAESTINGVAVNLRCDLVGDAMRWRWRLIQSATVEGLPRYEIWMGVTPVLYNLFLIDPTTGADTAWFPALQLGPFIPIAGIKEGFISRPGGKPIQLDTKLAGAEVPPYVKYEFGQTTAYGLQIDNGPTSSTTNDSGISDASTANAMTLGSTGLVLGSGNGLPGLGDNDMPDAIIPDTFIGINMSAIHKYPTQTTLNTAGATEDIVIYMRSTWSDANYAPPFATVLDAPKLIATNPNDPTRLQPSPDALNRADGAFDIFVTLDNVGGYATEPNPFPMNDTRVTLNLPAGVELVNPNEQRTKVINVINPRNTATLSWRVRPTGTVIGDITYNVEIRTVYAGTSRIRTVPGRITISATPRVFAKRGPNMVTMPWTFPDTSWEAILGLQTPTQFQAFEYSPDTQSYVPATSAERGKGYFLITANDLNGHQLPTAQQPADTATGARQIQLRSGWNMIGNTYNYAFPLGQIIGVSGADPDRSRTWTEMVASGFIDGTLAYYDPNMNGGAGGYQFIGGEEAMLDPTKAYWAFVPTAQPLALQFPPIFADFLPGSFRSVKDWEQTDKQWRLQIVARSKNALDSSTYVGVTTSNDEAKKLRMRKPPMAPGQTLATAIVENIDGKPAELAQSLAAGTPRREWKMTVYTAEEGSTTITWPNLSTIPSNVRFRIVDTATGVARDMRQSSGYTFEAEEGATREFKITMEPGGLTRALIGNVVVSRPSRDVDPNAPFTIAYTLASDATTSIRVLSSSGREVYTVSRGRADRSGENVATWNLRDSANRAVAPGSYRVEILAETENGDRVRKVVPVNVIR